MPSTSKYFCPRCLRTTKSATECTVCKIPTLNIGKRWRFPKHDSSRSKWKSELNKLEWYGYNEELRKTYAKFNLDYVVYESKEVITYKPNGKVIKRRLKNGSYC